MIILLALLHKLTVDQPTIRGRALVVLGAAGLAVGLAGPGWLVGLSGVGLLLGVLRAPRVRAGGNAA